MIRGVAIVSLAALTTVGLPEAQPIVRSIERRPDSPVSSTARISRLARPAAELQPGRRGEASPDERGGEAGAVERRARLALAGGHGEGRDRLRRQSPHLATGKDYGDFEFWVDWLMVSPNGDSGNLSAQLSAGADLGPGQSAGGQERRAKGSGALWNNNADNPGKWPLVKADNPVGEWNTLRIRMVGARVWIWLNDKPTVEGQVLDNFFDRGEPVLPARGPIELQTHGSEIRFRNI